MDYYRLEQDRQTIISSPRIMGGFQILNPQNANLYHANQIPKHLFFPIHVPTKIQGLNISGPAMILPDYLSFDYTLASQTLTDIFLQMDVELVTRNVTLVDENTKSSYPYILLLLREVDCLNSAFSKFNLNKSHFDQIAVYGEKLNGRKACMLGAVNTRILLVNGEIANVIQENHLTGITLEKTLVQ